MAGSGKSGLSSDAILDNLFSSLKETHAQQCGAESCNGDEEDLDSDSRTSSNDRGRNRANDSSSREKRKRKKEKKHSKKKRKKKPKRKERESEESERAKEQWKRQDYQRKSRPMSPPRYQRASSHKGSRREEREEYDDRKRPRSNRSKTASNHHRHHQEEGHRWRHDKREVSKEVFGRYSRPRDHYGASQVERPPKRFGNGSRDDDTFWDTKWEAMELQKEADNQERKGKHYLDAQGRSERRGRKRTLSPERRTRRLLSPDCDELKRLKELKEISSLTVKEKFVAEPEDPKKFQWDEKTKMWRRRGVAEDESEGDFSNALKNRMEEQVADGRQKFIPIDGKSAATLSDNAVEEIRMKREKFKREQQDGTRNESEEKEEGEVRSDDEQESHDQRKRRRSRSGSRKRSKRRRQGRSCSRRSSSRHRYMDYRRSYRRSMSRERRRSERDGFRGSRSEIDKAKLLAIARKNAVKLLNSENRRGISHDRLLAIKSGGQSLAQLTIFCRELAKKGITDEFSDDEITNRPFRSSDEEEDDGKMHHPFQVKDRPVPNPFSIGGGRGIQSEPLTSAAKNAARSHRMIEFPVSSGNTHRVKEHDKAISEDEKVAKEESSEKIEVKEEIPEPSVDRDEETEDEKVLTTVEKFNQANPLGVLMFGGAVEPKSVDASILGETEEEEEKPEKPDEAPLVPSIKEESDKVFDAVKDPTMAIGEIISQRLSAMKKLSSNPNDTEALTLMYEAQKEMSTWADSKNKPGQFTGHTGAKILSKGELNLGTQAWAKQEQFTNAPKVSGGFGEFLLKKMGWQEGDGLGKDKSGDVDPLTLDIKMDKKGLVAAEEAVYKWKKGQVLTMTGLDLSGKHPVTALTELCTRRHWGAPNFVQAFECGPSHKKQYIFKVSVNGAAYQPSIASDNKKKAKSDAATVALQQLGLLPRDPNNPM